MNPTETPARRRRIGAAAWLAWLAAAFALTIRSFLWHLDYFKHPGARFYPLFLAALAVCALAAPLYQRLRRGGFWRHEPALLAALPLAAGLFYELRATLVVAWIFLTCYAFGRFLRRKLGLEPSGFAEEIGLSAGLGFALLLPALFIMGACGWYYWWAFALLLVLADLAAIREFGGLWPALAGLNRAWSETPEAAGWLGLLLTGFSACFILCGTLVVLAPSLAYDVLAKHLPAALAYSAQHSWQPLPFDTYTYLPQGVETLMTLGYSLAGQAAAQMLPPIFFLLTLLLLIRLASACGAGRFSALAGMLFAASIPFLHWTGSVAKNDLAVAFFVLAALDCFLRWRDSGRFAWILLGVFFLAAGAGVKHTVLFGLFSLAPLYLCAVWRQPRRLRAAASLAAVFALFGLLWHARAFALSGNPVYPLALHHALQSTPQRPHLDWPAAALRFARTPWTLHFEGWRHFESPSPNPLGVFFVLFAPAWLLARRARASAKERACLLFCGLYLLYWAVLSDFPRYAIAPLALLAVLTTRRLMAFHADSGRLVRGSIHLAAAYALLFALPVAMILEINAPQFRLFARQIDKAGYLRQALVTFPSLEFLRARRTGEERVLALENASAAYAPNPRRFEYLLAGASADPAALVLARLGERDFRWLILPSDEMGREVERRLALARPATEVYRDPHFAVFRLDAR
jgi:4-amino-4-deoxy-L-arabinose transferase-like glycosyltransferase